MKRFPLIILFSILIFSCSKSVNQGYFLVKNALEEREEKSIRLETLPEISGKEIIRAKMPEFLATTSPSLTFQSTQKQTKEEKKELRKLIKEIKPQLKEIRKQAKQKESNLKKEMNQAGPTTWEPNVKIGVTLLLVGIVLSLFGLGLVGGISAIVGLAFLILGLLNSY